METDHDPKETAALALSFARTELGPASERIVADAASQALILSRLRGGARLEDAVLAEVHGRACADRRAADEFLAYFLEDAQRSGHRLLGGELRRFLETGDLVQSVLGSLWQDLGELRFETRAQFVALLAQRLRWKALDSSRRLRSERRGGDRQNAGDVVELGLQQGGPSPPSMLGLQEETEQLLLGILRLPERDQLLLRLHLRGEPLSALAHESGLQPETARKALQRAIRKLRALR